MATPLQLVQMAPLEPPRGMYSTHMDEKGRLKIPTDFQPFFIGMLEKTLFATSLDRKTALVYPMAVWRANEEFFARPNPDPALIDKLQFNANNFGSQTAMDGQGRVLLSPTLRRGLELENGSLRIWFHNGFFKVVNEQVFAEMDKAAAELAPADLQAARVAGLIM